MKKSPLISIVMPVHNGGKFVAEAISSVLNQTYINWELVIVDDASTDETKKILRKFVELDERIVIVKHSINQGIAKSLNDGIKQSKGQYVARMDSDDAMMPNRLMVQVSFMQSRPNVVVCGTDMEEIDDSGIIIGHRHVPSSNKKICEMMWYAMGLQHPTMMFNRLLIPSDFSWYRSIRYVEDLDLIFRLLKYGKVANVVQNLYQYRIHGQNESLKHMRATYLAALKVRWKALLFEGYRPNVKTVLLQVMSLVVLVLPPNWVWFLYKKMRTW